MGVAAHQAGKFEEAIALYNRALELPGSGAYRLSGTRRDSTHAVRCCPALRQLPLTAPAAEWSCTRGCIRFA